MTSMKRVYVAQSEAEAHLVAEELDAAGIQAVVKADTVAIPSIPFPSVWVENRDLARAQELLSRRTASPDGDV
jgi:hypothetical protein